MRKSLLLVSIICLIGLTSINAQLNQAILWQVFQQHFQEIPGTLKV
jgi:hypothetical protein